MWSPGSRFHFILISSLAFFLCQTRLLNAATLSNFSRRQSPSGSNLKAGLGWGGGGNISQFEGHQVGWYFTWAPTSWVTPPPALEYVPQFWGARDAATFGTLVNVSSVASNGWKNVLGMNEPQEPTQANLAPQDAANLWRAYLEPLKAAGARLGSPATTSAPNGKTWLQEFLTVCAGCSVDFVAVHWYGNVASEFIAYLEDFHNTFQRPIWVTEWSCLNFIGGTQCTYDEMVQFMAATQSYMDQATWVERYAWFGAMANLPPGINNFTALMDPVGLINPLGARYIGPPAGSAPPSSSVTQTSSSSTPGPSSSIPAPSSSVPLPSSSVQPTSGTPAPSSSASTPSSTPISSMVSVTSTSGTVSDTISTPVTTFNSSMTSSTGTSTRSTPLVVGNGIGRSYKTGGFGLLVGLLLMFINGPYAL